MTWPADIPNGDVFRLIRRGIGDPGSVLPRNDNYTESITNWSARAVHRLLVDADLLSPVRLVGGGD